MKVFSIFLTTGLALVCVAAIISPVSTIETLFIMSFSKEINLRAPPSQSLQQTESLIVKQLICPLRFD